MERMIRQRMQRFQTSIPALTYALFYEKLNLLPFDSAFNLPAVIAGVLGILFLFLFLYEATNPVVAFAGAFLLFFYPRYFGDMHTNVKDITTAAFYTASIYFAWRMLEKRKIVDTGRSVLLAESPFPR